MGKLSKKEILNLATQKCFSDERLSELARKRNFSFTLEPFYAREIVPIIAAIVLFFMLVVIMTIVSIVGATAWIFQMMIIVLGGMLLLLLGEILKEYRNHVAFKNAYKAYEKSDIFQLNKKRFEDLKQRHHAFLIEVEEFLKANHLISTNDQSFISKKHELEKKYRIPSRDASYLVLCNIEWMG